MPEYTCQNLKLYFSVYFAAIVSNAILIWLLFCLYMLSWGFESGALVAFNPTLDWIKGRYKQGFHLCRWPDITLLLVRRETNKPLRRSLMVWMFQRGDRKRGFHLCRRWPVSATLNKTNLCIDLWWSECLLKEYRVKRIDSL